MTPEQIEALRTDYTVATIRTLDAFKKAQGSKSIQTKCSCKEANIRFMIDSFFNWYDNEYKNNNNNAN